MCGRFAYIPARERLIAQFGISSTIEEGSARYNSAPGASVLCLVKTELKGLSGVLLRWGLVPFWTKELAKVKPLANARGETVFEKPAFRQAIKSKRCILPMSGFYEWHDESGHKQPYFFRMKNNDYLAVAAFWDTWHQGDEVLHTCCLITTTANSLVEPVHQRMPALLDKDAQALWLDNTRFDKAELSRLIKPYASDELISYPVSTKVNQARFNEPSAIEPLE